MVINKNKKKNEEIKQGNAETNRNYEQEVKDDG